MKNPINQTNKSYAYPILVILLCASFLFYKYVMQVSPSVMAKDIMQAFNMTGADLGHLAAIYFYSYVVMQLFVGLLVDRYGTRVLASIAILICAAGAYFFSKSQTALHAELSRALMGIGVAFATISYMKMAAVWFNAKQFAFIAGLAATSAMIGAVLGQNPLSQLIETYGWREAMVICSAIGVLLAILFFLIVRNNPKDYVKTPLEVKETSSLKSELVAVLGNKQNWLLTFYNSFIFAPLAIFGGLWGNLFLIEAYQISKNDAAFLVSFSFVGLAFGAPLIGLFSERFGRRRLIMMVTPLVACLSISLVVYAHLSFWWVAIGLFLFGFSIGGFILSFAIGRDLNHVALIATFMALINSGDAIFIAVSETLVGKFLDLTWDGSMVEGARHFSLGSFQQSFAIMPVYFVLAALLMFFIKEVRVTEK